MILLELGDFSIELSRKKIKNIHLKVYPPHGQIKVSAPHYMPIKIIQEFIQSKSSWIQKQQDIIQSRQTGKPHEYKSGECHFFMGKPYTLAVEEKKSKPRLVLAGDLLLLQIRPGQNREKRREILDSWYRAGLKEALPPLISRYESIMKVKIKEFRIKKMKTRWGTCHIRDKRIWINLELAKKSPPCLEYIVVHEMCHLLEKGHNQRFYQLMDSFLPLWRTYRKELNSPPSLPGSGFDP